MIGSDMMHIEISKYLTYINKRDDCFKAFNQLVKTYHIKSGIYPGSYIHITPSLVIPEMHYVDMDRKAIKFFHEQEEILSYINTHKTYHMKSKITFEPTDFNKNLIVTKTYDLLISLYAGFISQAAKKYLKIGGILLSNDSHGDATLAYYDEDYRLIGVMDNTNSKIINNQLEAYFKLKTGTIDLNKVKLEMKGPKYIKRIEYYIFKKIK
jgi:hypothetical protein